MGIWLKAKVSGWAEWRFGAFSIYDMPVLRARTLGHECQNAESLCCVIDGRAHDYSHALGVTVSHYPAAPGQTFRLD